MSLKLSSLAPVSDSQFYPLPTSESNCALGLVKGIQVHTRTVQCYGFEVLLLDATVNVVPSALFKPAASFPKITPLQLLCDLRKSHN